jgi:four helix bundle protein
MKEKCMAIAEFKKELEERTLSFSVDVLNYLFKMPTHPVFKVITYQLVKSGSSIGANYREANRAESKSDFIHKIGIVEKESSESHYWLTVLSRINFLEKSLQQELQPLLGEAEELLRLFTTINKKSKATP